MLKHLHFYHCYSLVCCLLVLGNSASDGDLTIEPESTPVGNQVSIVIDDIDDDRDLIIIDHARHHQEEIAAAEEAKPSRRKYSQLFARLRQA